MILMGLDEEAKRGARTDRHAAVVRPRHRREELRDHDPPARWPALGLPAHRRRAPAQAGRRSRHAPAAGVRLADRPAVRQRQPAHRQGARQRQQSGRNRHAAARVRHAEQAHRQSGLLRQGQARAGRDLQAPLQARSGRRTIRRRARASGPTPAAIRRRIDSYYEYLWKCWRLFGDARLPGDVGRRASPRPTAISPTKCARARCGTARSTCITGKRTGSEYGALDAFYARPAGVLGGDVGRARRLQDSSLEDVAPARHRAGGLRLPQDARSLTRGYPLRPEIVESA